jgi:hypothetical protein
VAKRLWEDRLVPTDLWVLYGEQDYPKNFHATGFTPNMLKSLVTATGIYEDIEVKEGNVGDETPNPTAWNLELRAKKVKHLEVENITPEWIDAPPQNDVWWPMKLHQTYNERPLTPEEITADSLKWMSVKPEGVNNDDMELFAPGQSLKNTHRGEQQVQEAAEEVKEESKDFVEKIEEAEKD